MGGHALKKTFTRRHDAAEFFVKESEVVRTLMQTGQYHAAGIPAYANKPTFGDIDILYTNHCGAPGLDVETVRALFNEFGANEIVKNGSVISFDYKEIQVDLIYTSSLEFNYAKSYFSYNDLGNLIGRLAKKFGLKHGHKGLFLPVKDGDYGIEEILVTRDHDKTLQFLGLDIARFDAGFDELEDVFEYVASSYVFDPKIYLFENVNAVSRIRDKKRATYNKFLEWCRENDARLPHNPPIVEYIGRERVFEFFGEHVRAQYQAALAKVAFNRAVKAKFNGDLVRQLTLKDHKELGQLMQHLMKQPFFKSENIFTASVEDIADQIRKENELHQN